MKWCVVCGRNPATEGDRCKYHENYELREKEQHG